MKYFLLIYFGIYFFAVFISVQFLNNPFNIIGLQGQNLAYLLFITLIPTGTGMSLWRLKGLLQESISNQLSFENAIGLLVIVYIELIVLFAVLFSVSNVFDNAYNCMAESKWVETLDKNTEKEEQVSNTIQAISSVQNSVLFKINGLDAEKTEDRVIISSSKNGEIEYKANYENSVYRLIDSIYFSAVTITTAGYGDISPKGIYPRILSVIELLTGQFLLIIGVGITLGKLETKF